MSDIRQIKSPSRFKDYILVYDESIPVDSDSGQFLRVETYYIRNGNVIVRHPINKKYYVIRLDFFSDDEFEFAYVYNFKARGYYFRTYDFDNNSIEIKNVLKQKYSSKKQIKAVQALLRSLNVYNRIVDERGANV